MCKIARLDICRLIQESFVSPTFEFGDVDISNDTFVYTVKKYLTENKREIGTIKIDNNTLVIAEHDLKIGKYEHELMWIHGNNKDVVVQGIVEVTDKGSSKGCRGPKSNIIEVVTENTIVNVSYSESVIIVNNGSSEWGSITGDIENQTDLVNFIDGKIEEVEVDLSNYYNKQEINEQSKLTTTVSNEEITPINLIFLGNGYIGQQQGVPGQIFDQVSPNTNYRYTDYIDVSMFSDLIVSGFFGTGNGVTTYNNDKTVNGIFNSATFGGVENSQFTDARIILPANTKYIRMSSRADATNVLKGLDITTESTTEVVTHQELYDLIQNNTVQQEIKEVLYLEKPKFAEIYFEGNLPTDESDNRIPTELNWKMKVNNKIIASAKCELSIQGHGSVAYPKKGYTFDVFNANNDGLKLKFGDMVAVDSFHLKAYATDTTHARDVSNCRIWRDMIKQLDYPYNKVDNRPYSISASNGKNTKWTYDANYYTEGFPVAIYVNGVFHGLYTLRNKKTRENYALDNSNINHIFLDSGTYTAYLKEVFNPTDWEIKSPKMTGYTDLGPIPAAYPTVQIACNNLFNFTRQLSTTYANHANIINLPHWIVWIIFSELISNRDTDGNNYNIITWDGVHWSIIPYDLDLTIGLDAWNNYTIQNKRDSQDVNHDIWTTFKSVYNTDIKELYTKLRNSGFLTSSNLFNYYKDQVEGVPRWIYENDRQKWNLIWTTGEPNLEQIHFFIDAKLNYLDGIWLNQ